MATKYVISYFRTLPRSASSLHSICAKKKNLTYTWGLYNSVQPFSMDIRRVTPAYSTVHLSYSYVNSYYTLEASSNRIYAVQ